MLALVVPVVIIGLMFVCVPLRSSRRLGVRIIGVGVLIMVVVLLLGDLVAGASDVVTRHGTPVAVGAAVVVGAIGLFLLRRRGAIPVRGVRPRVARPDGAARMRDGDAEPARADLLPSLRPFVGKDERGRLRFADAEDTIGVVGPPRAGKTTGILIPQVMGWAGPVISASVREDVLAAAARQRRRVADDHGGEVLVFDPTGRSTVSDGVRRVRWSPLTGCADAGQAARRAAAMVGATRRPGSSGGGNEEFFAQVATMLLRGMFHAAATGGYGLTDVLAWVDGQDLDVPAILLDRSGTDEGPRWAERLRSLHDKGDNERGAAFSTAANALDAFNAGGALDACRETDFDLRRMLATRSSLFVVAGAADQEAIAPVISGLLASLLWQMIDDLPRERGGRPGVPALVQLDEVANIAPLPDLPRLLTLAGGSGVCLCWAAQSWRQLADRYGEDRMHAVWQASKAQIVFGGVRDRTMLEEISTLLGTQDERDVTRQYGRVSPVATGRSTGLREVPRLRVEELADPDNVHLLHRGGFEPGVGTPASRAHPARTDDRRPNSRR